MSAPVEYTAYNVLRAFHVHCLECVCVLVFTAASLMVASTTDLVTSKLRFRCVSVCVFGLIYANLLSSWSIFIAARS